MNPHPTAGMVAGEEIVLDPDTASTPGVRTSELADDVRQAMLQAVADIPGVEGIGCLLLDGAGALRYVQATDAPGAMLEVAEELSLEGPCHEAFVVGDTIVADVQRDPRWPRLGAILGATPIHAVIGVPIMLEGSAIGALNAYTQARTDWGEDELAALRIHAQRVGAMLAAALQAYLDHHGDSLTAQIRAALANRETLAAAARVVGEDAGLSEATAALRIRQIGAVTGMSATAVAQGILTRGRLPELGEVSMLQEAERRHREEMARLALTDPLTGLANRVRLLDRLEQALVRSERSGTAPALLFVDLDRFKAINDSMGHEAGDQVLCRVADRLRGATRLQDTVARLGGDEFAVLCEPVDEAVDVEAVGRRVLEALAAPVTVSFVTAEGAVRDHQLFIQASVGITVPDPSTRPTDVLRDADIAMYDAKRRGGGMAIRTIPLQESATRTARLEHALRDALDGYAMRSHGVPLPADFAVHYQPVVTLDGGQITTLEALVRWCPAELGEVPASELIALAERVGLIVPLGAAILQRACEDARSWRADPAITRTPVVAVNITAQQLAHPGFYETVQHALAAGDLPPQSLGLEIVESEVLHAAGSALATMTKLTADGVHLSLDDFGTGLSSLSYLTRLPIQQLKIDQSFVAGVDTDTADRAVARSIIGLGGTLDLWTVAEGVETRAQELVLAEMGCNLGQGHLYSPPVPPEDVPALIVARGVAAHPRA